MAKPEVEEPITTVGRRRPIDRFQQLAFQLEALRRAFLDEFRLGHGLLERRGEGQPVRRGVGGEAERCERRPGGRDQLAQPRFGVRRRVPGHDLIAARQKMRRPAAADHAGADAGDALDLRRLGAHGCALSPGS